MSLAGAGAGQQAAGGASAALVTHSRYQQLGGEGQHQRAAGGTRGQQGAYGGLYVTFNPLVMTRLFSQHVTGPLIALVRYPGGLRNVE